MRITSKEFRKEMGNILQKVIDGENVELVYRKHIFHIGLGKRLNLDTKVEPKRLNLVGKELKVEPMDEPLVEPIKSILSAGIMVRSYAGVLSDGGKYGCGCNKVEGKNLCQKHQRV